MLEKNIDLILRVSNVEVAIECILRGDCSKSMSIINNSPCEVIVYVVLDIHTLLGEYQTWLGPNNAQQKEGFRGFFDDQWPSLISVDEFNREDQMQAQSTSMLEEYNLKVATIPFQLKILGVVIETFGGFGIVGLLASVLA